MPGELAAEERPDEPRVASVRSDGAAAARDAGGVPDAPRVEPAHSDSGDVAQRVPAPRAENSSAGSLGAKLHRRVDATSRTTWTHNHNYDEEEATSDRVRAATATPQDYMDT